MQTIINFFKNIVNWVLSLFSAVWEFFCDLLDSFISQYFSPLIDLIPDFSPMWSYLEPIRPYTAFLNQIIALDTASNLISAYFIFISMMIMIKLIIKLFVPTVG